MSAQQRPDYLPADAVLIFNEPRMQVWREKTVQYTKLTGEIDDPGSVWWRGSLDDVHKKHGFPPFMALDVVEAVATNSMSMRLKSAGWARALLTNLQEGVIYNGANHTSGFVIRAILRVAGMPNVSTIGSAQDLARVLDAWRKGTKALR